MSLFNGARSFVLLKQLSFPRFGGTKEENQAAKIILNTLRGLKLNYQTEAFRVKTYNKTQAKLEVLEPYKKHYLVVAIGLTGNTPRKGIKNELVYLNAFDRLSLNKASGKIALFYRDLKNDFYGELKKSKISAFIRVVNHDMQQAHSALIVDLIKKYGQMPGVTIDYEDGLELIRRKAKKIKLYSRQDIYWGTSHNLIATVRGTQLPNEIICVCAHYDSVLNCPGALDNAGGSVSLLEFIRYFRENPPMRTIQFVWFASEERGLLGSRNYVSKHKNDLRKIKLLVNMDMTGAILGNNNAIICGSRGLKKYIVSMAKGMRVSLKAKHDAYSSDNIPFNASGIPSASFNRAGGRYVHTPKDTVRLIDAKHLQLMGEFGLKFLKQIANTLEIPFSLKIKNEDKESAAQYVKRNLLLDLKRDKK